MIYKSLFKAAIGLAAISLVFFNACNNAKSEQNANVQKESINNASVVDLASTNNSLSPVKTELEKAKKSGKAAFVVVTGTGSTDTDKALKVAKGANAIYKNSVVLQMSRDDSDNADLVKEWRLTGAPLPLILVVSTKGLLTGGYVLQDATSENIAELVPSPKLELVYEAISIKKHAIVVFTKKTFTDRTEVIKISKDAVSQLKDEAIFVEVDMDDKAETGFMKQLRIDNLTTKSSVTLVINKQGQVAGTSTTVPDAAKLVAAAKTPVKSGCGPGCGPAGCSK
jgi:hypothetical protein